jgi:uncharacterized membrane protein YphA (DoxX/SURF4 family)
LSAAATTEHPHTPGPLGSGVARGLAPLSSLVLLTLRVALGGIFCIAAATKLANPQSFSEAIQAFKIVRSDELVLMGTHLLPCVEMLAGIALVLGCWTREAALIIGLLLLMFIWAVVAAIGKGLAGVPCSCFGYWHLFCTGGVGWCKVWENSGLTAIAAGLVFAGGGRVALDRVFSRTRAA